MLREAKNPQNQGGCAMNIRHCGSAQGGWSVTAKNNYFFPKHATKNPSRFQNLQDKIDLLNME